MSLYNEQDITVHIRGTMGDGFLNESKYIAYSKTYNAGIHGYTTADAENSADSSRNSVSIDKVLNRITNSSLVDSNKSKLLIWGNDECIKAYYGVTTSSSGLTNQSTDSSIPTSATVYNAITNGFNTNNACLFRGTYTPASTSNATTLGGTWNNSSGPVNGKSQGYMWIADSGGYFYDIVIEAGDLIICGIDTPVDKSSYYVIQKNIDPSTYVTLAGTQTITGAKTFSSITVNGDALINGNITGTLIGNASSATKLYSNTQVGSASIPVYFSNGVPVQCTSGSVFSGLSSNSTNCISITVAGQNRVISTATFVTNTKQSIQDAIQLVNSASFATATVDTAQIIRMTLSKSNDGSDITADIPLFAGATSEVAGTAGLVPQPAKNDQNKYLRANGTWSAITTNQVYQSESTNNIWRPIILGYPSTSAKETDFSSATQPVFFDQQLRFNPSTNELYLDGSITATGNIAAATFNSRSILDNTTATAITASTSIITANTLYNAIPSLNGNKSYNGGTTIYAPTSSGSSGDILKSKGANNAPEWISVDTAINGILPKTETAQTTVSVQSDTWTETDLLSAATSDDSGTYIIQINDIGTGVVHSGIFSLGPTASTTNSLEEIYLHVFNPDSSLKKRLYAAIKDRKLWLASDNTTKTNHTIVVKYRLLI